MKQLILKVGDQEVTFEQFDDMLKGLKSFRDIAARMRDEAIKSPDLGEIKQYIAFKIETPKEASK